MNLKGQPACSLTSKRKRSALPFALAQGERERAHMGLARSKQHYSVDRQTVSNILNTVLCQINGLSKSLK